MGKSEIVRTENECLRVRQRHVLLSYAHPSNRNQRGRMTSCGSKCCVAKESTNENLCMYSRPVAVIMQQHQSTVPYDFSGCPASEHPSTHPMACGSPCVRPHRDRRDGKQELRAHHTIVRQKFTGLSQGCPWASPVHISIWSKGS
jgi:hypothetical protein